MIKTDLKQDQCNPYCAWRMNYRILIPQIISFNIKPVLKAARRNNQHQKSCSNIRKKTTNNFFEGWGGEKNTKCISNEYLWESISHNKNSTAHIASLGHCINLNHGSCWCKPRCQSKKRERNIQRVDIILM